jgi:hypothetical protein
LIIGFSGLFFVLVVVFSALLYAYFAQKPGCGINVFYITVNIILVIVMSVVSVLPKVQEHNPRSGIFQAGLLSLYTTYLVGSAIGSQPNDETFSCRSIASSGQVDDGLSRFIIFSGIAITFIALGRQAISAGSAKLFTTKEDELVDEDQGEATYNYSWFHFIFILAGMYSTSGMVCSCS